MDISELSASIDNTDVFALLDEAAIPVPPLGQRIGMLALDVSLLARIAAELQGSNWLRRDEIVLRDRYHDELLAGLRDIAGALNDLVAALKTAKA